MLYGTNTKVVSAKNSSINLSRHIYNSLNTSAQDDLSVPAEVIPARPDFSLVLACYLDAPHIFKNTQRIARILSDAGFVFELVFVNDASPDHTDAELRKASAWCAEQGIPTQLIRNKTNLGRGLSVQKGMAAASAPICGYIDSDLEPDPKKLPDLIHAVRNGSDCAVGKRRIIQERFSFSRFVLHHAHRRIASAAFRLPIQDPHAGMKVFRKKAVIPVFAHVKDKHWFWDTEVLSLIHEEGLKITEHPIDYQRRTDKKTTVKLIPDAWKELVCISGLLLRKFKRRLAIGSALAAMLALGIFLRVTAGDAIEFKTDEAQTVSFALSSKSPVAFVGLDTSNGLHHPGFGLTIFAAAARIFDLKNPPQIAAVTMALNSLALVAFFLFLILGLHRCTRKERAAWNWAFALTAASPLYMIWERKIWQPSILPLFVTALVISWWCRKEWRLYAFTWGLMGALIGQVHLSAYFFAIALFLGTLIWDRRGMSWRAWTLGSSLGAAALLPWLLQVGSMDGGALTLKLHRIFTLKYFNYWFSNPMGWPFRGSLGADLWDFLKHPFVFGHPTHLLGVAFFATCLVGAFFVWRSIQWLRTKPWTAKPATQTQILLVSAGLICGLLATFSGLNITRYFMLSVWFLPMLFFSKILLGVKAGHAALAIAVLCQFFLSYGFIEYAKKNPAIRGEFGRPYWTLVAPVEAQVAQDSEVAQTK